MVKITFNVPYRDNNTKNANINLYKMYTRENLYVHSNPCHNMPILIIRCELERHSLHTVGQKS